MKCLLVLCKHVPSLNPNESESERKGREDEATLYLFPPHTIFLSLYISICKGLPSHLLLFRVQKSKAD
jgi:hypothetical protein